MYETRQVVGIFLRLPIVLILTMFWVVYKWPFYVAFALAYLLFKPLLYYFVWIGVWLWYAFEGSNKSILPDYWKRFPDQAFQAAQSGFPHSEKMAARWLAR